MFINSWMSRLLPPSHTFLMTTTPLFPLLVLHFASSLMLVTPPPYTQWDRLDLEASTPNLYRVVLPDAMMANIAVQFLHLLIVERKSNDNDVWRSAVCPKDHSVHQTHQVKSVVNA